MSRRSEQEEARRAPPLSPGQLAQQIAEGERGLDAFDSMRLRLQRGVNPGDIVPDVLQEQLAAGGRQMHAFCCALARALIK